MSMVAAIAALMGPVSAQDTADIRDTFSEEMRASLVTCLRDGEDTPSSCATRARAFCFENVAHLFANTRPCNVNTRLALIDVWRDRVSTSPIRSAYFEHMLLQGAEHCMALDHHFRTSAEPEPPWRLTYCLEQVAIGAVEMSAAGDVYQ